MIYFRKRRFFSKFSGKFSDFLTSKEKQLILWAVLYTDGPVILPFFLTLLLGVLTAINCYNVKWATRVQDLFTGTKLLALVVIIVAGLYALGAGKTENLQVPFQNTISSPGYIALSFYSGLFSYAGW